MTVSVQLTPWALAGLLAVLVVLRDLFYLWPRRREPAVPAFLALAGLSGVWAAMHLVGTLAPSPQTKVAFVRAEYVPTLLATLALLRFALVQGRRRGDLRGWPVRALYASAALGIGLLLWGDTFAWLVRSAAEAPRGDLVDVAVTAGPWHWVIVGTTAAVGAVAGWVLLDSLRGRTGVTGSRALVACATALVVIPAVLHVRPGPQPYGSDLSAVGFALAAGALALGLLRPRLLGIGPVARKLVLDELRDPVVVFDGAGHIVDLNRAAETTLGLQVFGDVPLPLGTLWASSRSGRREATRIPLPTGDGEEEGIFEVTVTSLTEGGSSAHSALLLRDVTTREQMEREREALNQELKRANEELKRLADTDALTGLANRRHFMRSLELEMERSSRYARPVSLVLLDLDHFKKVNDTHGHAAGDDVLRSSAEVLRAACRDVDLAARIGGEELALLLPETQSEGAWNVAERIRKQIEAGQHRSPEGLLFRVTASIGVASARGPKETGEELLQASDEALYAAKRGGRNRIVIASR